jgi:hypothetical protein
MRGALRHVNTYKPLMPSHSDVSTDCAAQLDRVQWRSAHVHLRVLLWQTIVRDRFPLAPWRMHCGNHRQPAHTTRSCIALCIWPRFDLQLLGIKGIHKQKLELKYDTFQKVTTLEEELKVNKYFKLKGRIDSSTVRNTTVFLFC